MNLLILGADSLVGQALAAALVRQEQAHAALDTDAFVALQHGELLKIFSRFNPTQVIYVAAFSDIEAAEADEACARRCDQINSLAVSTVAEVCQKLQLPLLYHSSSYVFDGRKTHPYREDDETNPQCRYGQSKLAGERAIREILPNHLILRTDWVFSREQPDYFVRLLQRFREGRGQLTLMNRRFSPTPAVDVARVLLGVARQIDCAAEVWGTYHYCALQSLGQESFAEQVLQEVAKYDTEVAALLPALELVRQPVQAPWLVNSVLSSQRLFETFGIKQRSRAAELNALLQMLCNYTPPQVAAPSVAITAQPIPQQAPAEVDRQGVPRRRLKKKTGSVKPASKDVTRIK